MNLQFAPVPSAGDAVARALDAAKLSDATQLLDAIDARRIELQMSNEALESASGLCAGHVAKVLSPARSRSPTLETVDKILTVLQLSIVLVRDPSKATGASWKPRDTSHVRQRLSPATIARARPHVVAALLRRAYQPKWRTLPAPTFLKALAKEDGP